MPFQSVSTLEKPLPHIALPDWKYQYECMRNVAQARVADTMAIRYNSRAIRDETRIEDHWATYDSNIALRDRILELNSWRDIISRVGDRIDNEIKLLIKEKELTEREVDAIAEPIANISDLLSQRDSRLGSEMTYDEPDVEIKNELRVLENNQKLLSKCCLKAWEKLSALEDVRLKITMELEDKADAVNVESAQCALHRDSAYISNKLDCMGFSKKFNTYPEWLSHTKYIKQMAENELTDTTAMRESLFVCRQKATTILQSQQERTELITRKRIFDTQRARNDLEFQRKRLSEEIERSACDIKELESALMEKTKSLRLAETRLENLKARRNAELVKDIAYEALCVEVGKQKAIQAALESQIEQSKVSFNLLGEQIQKITFDLSKKDHALMTDRRALEIRELFKQKLEGLKVYNPSVQTDRNVKMMSMQDVITKI